MVFKDGADLVDVAFGLFIFGTESGDFVGILFEKAEEALFLLVHVEALELGDDAGKDIANFA